MLREEAKLGSELGKTVAEMMRKGNPSCQESTHYNLPTLIIFATVAQNIRRIGRWWRCSRHIRISINIITAKGCDWWYYFRWLPEKCKTSYLTEEYTWTHKWKEVTHEAQMYIELLSQTYCLCSKARENRPSILMLSSRSSHQVSVSGGSIELCL